MGLKPAPPKRWKPWPSDRDAYDRPEDQMFSQSCDAVRSGPLAISIKTLAQHLGFMWRDTHPFGAASIEWYDRFAHGDVSGKERILCNEDDCYATRALSDAIRLYHLTLFQPPAWCSRPANRRAFNQGRYSSPRPPLLAPSKQR